MHLDQIPPQDPETHLWRIVIETPRGSRHKYAFDPELGALLMKKSLPEGMVFPFDFGFLPQTKGGDGDPLDALVLADGPIVSGCVVPSRIIGLIEAEQRQEDGKKCAMTALSPSLMPRSSFVAFVGRPIFLHTSSTKPSNFSCTTTRWPESGLSLSGFSAPKPLGAFSSRTSALPTEL
jgi:hypothetical protein